MSPQDAAPRLVTAGRVGRAHGLEGSFRVIEPRHPLIAGTELTVAGRTHTVRSRRGSDDHPILALKGVSVREDAVALGGELLLVAEQALPLEEGEWLTDDLVGLEVTGLGPVRGVLDGPSCDVLELADGTLIPLIADAVIAIDLAAGTIEANLAFLGRDVDA